MNYGDYMDDHGAIDKLSRPFKGWWAIIGSARVQLSLSNWKYGRSITYGGVEITMIQGSFEIYVYDPDIK